MDLSPIQDFKYFHRGIFMPRTPIYGLYEPILDMFLLILDSAEHAETLKYIASSRYTLHVYRIDTAINFTDIHMDNVCCHNWSLTKKEQLLNIEYALHNTDIVAIEEFCPSSNTRFWNIDEEKRWLMFCQHVLKQLDQYPGGSRYKNMFRTLGGVFEVEEFRNVGNLVGSRHEILSKLYLGSDIPSVKQQIQDILNKFFLKELI